MEISSFPPSGTCDFKVAPKYLENVCAYVTGYASLTAVLDEKGKNEKNVKCKFKMYVPISRIIICTT